jgi:hypothetical protein
MEHLKERHLSTRLQTKKLLSPLTAVVGVASMMAAIALVYLGYDLFKAHISPCNSIFEQTSLGLSTKIKFLKAEGELQIGRDAVAELDERAQLVALNLKTCCTVLDAGRLNPEQFLQCKGKARQYDAKVQDVVALLQPKASTNTAPAAPASRGPAELVMQTPAAEIFGKAVDAARNVSREFNQQVVDVQKEQALQSLQAVPPAQIEIAAAEQEPNNDALSANILPLDTWVRAAINPIKDNDFFAFTTPATYRDWIRIEVRNQSTTWDPNFELFDNSKSSIASAHNATAGGDLAYDFVAPPTSLYIVRVSSYYGQSTGVYLIRVSPQKGYDSFEPNDDILKAKRINVGAPIKAKIMDKDDVDFYFADGQGERQMTVRVANQSTTLHPNIVVFDGNKTEIGNQHNSTAGGDLSFTFKAPPGAVYVRLSDYYVQNGGEYALTIEVQ